MSDEYGYPNDARVARKADARRRQTSANNLAIGVAVGAGSNLFDFFTKGGLKGCFLWLIGFAFFVFIVYNLMVGP